MIASIDRINECLSVLGYSEGEKVFIRKIHCNGKNDKSLKPLLNEVSYPIKENQITQESGYGVYFVVNGQGRKAENITHAKALFCEFDDIPKDEQYRKIMKHEHLPLPTFMIDSGGKSYHWYWGFDEPVPIAQWRILIADLIDWVGSDPTIKDPPRVMRLPEFYHYSAINNEVKQNNKSEFKLLSNQKYSYQTLRDIIPHSLPKEAKKIDYSQVNDTDIINFILQVVKPHQSGTNTYSNYRELLGAIKNLYGDDNALLIADAIRGNDNYNWEQIVNSTNGNFGLGTIYYQLTELGFITKQDWANLFKSTNNSKSTQSERTNKSDKSNSKKQSKKEEEDSIAIARQILKDNYQDRLKYNELKKVVELDNEEAILDDFYLDLHEDYDLQIGKQVAYDLAVRFAKKQSYHPVKDYLESLNQDDETIDIKQLSSKIFGTEDPIFDTFLYRFLIASVARIYQSGCKSDHCLILKGNQGIGKSSFFKTLYGENFFTDSVTGTDRDNLLVAHQNWFLELAEFETITGKKVSGELKAFVSKSNDTFREPYAKSTRTIKRQFVIGGSVNEDTFLVDTTGNRRYLVIPIEQEINLKFVKKYRDVIWYQAKLAYQSDERWYLDRTEQAYSETLNKGYLHHDSWDCPELEAWLNQHKKGISTRDILRQFFNLTDKDINKGHEMRLGKIMKSNSWNNKLKTIYGKRQRVWITENDCTTYIKISEQPQLDDQKMITSESQSEQGCEQPAQPEHLKSPKKDLKSDNNSKPDSVNDFGNEKNSKKSLPKIDVQDDQVVHFQSEQGFQTAQPTAQPQQKDVQEMINEDEQVDPQKEAVKNEQIDPRLEDPVIWRKALNKELKLNGITEKDSILAYFKKNLNRTVTSFNDLSIDDCSLLINHLRGINPIFEDVPGDTPD